MPPTGGRTSFEDEEDYARAEIRPLHLDPLAPLPSPAVVVHKSLVTAQAPRMQQRSLSSEQPQESPVRRARRLVQTFQIRTYSRGAKQHYQRVGSTSTYPVPVFDLLDREYAPLKVCRWVAYGAHHQDQVVRLALALLLRKEADLMSPGKSCDGWAWPQDHTLSLGERLFKKTDQYARLVRIGLLAEAGAVPRNMTLFTEVAWSRTWGAIQAELRTINLRNFYEQIDRLAASRKRRIVRKRSRRLAPDAQAFVEVLGALQRGVLEGHIKLENNALEKLGANMVPFVGEIPRAPAPANPTKPARTGFGRPRGPTIDLEEVPPAATAARSGRTGRFKR